MAYVMGVRRAHPARLIAVVQMERPAPTVDVSQSQVAVLVETEHAMAWRTVHLVLPIVALVPIVLSRQRRVYAQTQMALHRALPTKIVRCLELV